jgi:hypothetical protein
MVIGVRGVLGNLNATPAIKNRALAPCRTRTVRPALDNPTRPDRFSQPTVLEMLAGTCGPRRYCRGHPTQVGEALGA